MKLPILRAYLLLSPLGIGLIQDQVDGVGWHLRCLVLRGNKTQIALGAGDGHTQDAGSTGGVS